MTSLDPMSLIFHAVNSIIALGALYHTLTKGSAKKAEVCQAEFQALKTKVAVLESQIDSESHMLEKLDEKLDRLIEKE